MDRPTDPRALGDLAADYWLAVLETDPLLATQIGDHRFADRLADGTAEGIAMIRAGRETLLAQTAAIDPGACDPEARITLSVLREALVSDLAGLDTGLRDWNVDVLDGIPTMFLDVPDYQRLETPADGSDMVARWRAMAGATDVHAATLRRSATDGRVACAAPVRRTIDMLGGLLAQPDEVWSLLEPLGRVEDLKGWSNAERAGFATGLRDAVTDGVRPAFTRLHDLLLDEILPAARPDDRPGMGHVAGGENGYCALIRVHTSLDLAPEDLHRTGLAEIARIDTELRELAGRTIGATTLEGALAALRTDRSLHFTTRDELHAAAQTGLERANAAVPDWFGRLPVAPCEVVPMPSHEEEHSTIAYYRSPAVDGSRPGQFYLNLAHPETRPRYELEALTYHESVPGHHLQIAIGQELPLTAEFRRHLGTTAFFEGWGLYTERLADEMGLYSGDLDRIGVLSYDAWRAARLVVDTGMHALGWTRRQAIDFMLAHTALAPNNIVNEVDRYIGLPGQALAYKTGQLEMLRLRVEARERLGGAFDIRSFHDALLGNGAVPLPTLSAIVEAWVAERIARA